VIAGALLNQGTVRERMRMGLKAYLDFVQANPVAPRMLMSAERHPEQEQPDYDFEHLRERHLTTLEALFREGQRSGEVRENIDIEETALALFGIIEHRVVLWLNGRAIPPNFADRTIELVFDGARA
jgi:AcrR family transcriptional regulator